MVMKQAEVLSDEWNHSEYDSGVKAYAMNNSYDVELMVTVNSKSGYGKRVMGRLIRSVEV